ncbi:hypothetical protein [Streptomyces sp. NPDC059788]|uniref:hypothetical protein n=1 Tax=Streptomyces sp. NPDC059788 TaxID=3346948 RepID=UPI003646E305
MGVREFSGTITAHREEQAGGALVDIIRQNPHLRRPLPDISDHAAAVVVPARAHSDSAEAARRTMLRLRSHVERG